MATGSQNMTTYLAKQIIGSNAAADPAGALLQTGYAITTDTWILNRTNRSNYGVLYHYDSNGADKIKFIGGISNDNDIETAWIELGTGNTHILGKVGIGKDPTINNNPYKLYINGTTYTNAPVYINNSTAVAMEDDNGALVIGDKAGLNIGIDNCKIHARDNSAAANLSLNSEGGNIILGINDNNYYVNIRSQQDASSTSTGALRVDGGVSIAKKLYVGNELDLKNNLHLYTNSDASPDIVWWYADKEQEQARIWMGSGGASVFAPNYRCYTSDGTLLYSGKLAIGDGTGVTDAASFRSKLSTWALVSSTYNTFMPSDGTTNAWYKFGTTDGYGILPAVTGGAEDGHSSIGTSSWYWKYLYVDRAYTGKITIQQPAAHRDNGIVGTYDYTKAAAIWSMGASYQIQADGSGLGNLYGAAYGYENEAYLNSHSLAGGHQFIWCNNGDAKVALGNNIWAKNNITAGTDITAGRYLYCTYVNESCSTETPTTSSYWIYANSDGWLRKSTLSNLGEVLGNTYLMPRYGVGSTASNSYILVTINPETSWMLNFTLKLYQSYEATDIQISGYNYGSNHWHLPQTRILGSTTTSGIKVYFGYTATWKLWVAVDGGNYNGAEVVDVCNGYTQIDRYNAFTVTKVNSLPGTIETTVTAYRPWYRDETVSNATTAASCSGNAATATRINGNLGAISSNTNCNIWVSSTSSADGIPKYVSGVYVNASAKAIYASKVYNAVWNDFAEYRVSDITEGGRVLVSDGKGHLILSTERLQPSARVISDTFGCSVGMSDSAKTPIGVAGRVLVYPYQPRENYKVGDALCAAPNGTADIMTREEIIQYPDRIIGIVDEVPDYEVWDQIHTNKSDNGEVEEQNHTNIEVKGRIWIYVK